MKNEIINNAHPKSEVQSGQVDFHKGKDDK